MKCLATLLLIATLASCSAPVPEPPDEAAVVEPGVVCRASHDGGPVVAERGIGGTGAPAMMQLSDRGIGGTGISNTSIGSAGIGSTGIVGVVTGFASICVDEMEVRVTPAIPLSINGTPATTGQLRVGQLAVIKAAGPVTAPDFVAQAQIVSIRYEVSGPIEAVDISSGAMMVAGQRVMVLPVTWVAGRFGVGNWVTVSGLRQPDGTINASRLDRARAGTLSLRGKINRQRDTTRIGSLVLHGPWVATVEEGTFVSILGHYENGAAEVTTIEPDLLSADPVSYFGASTRQIIMQAFVHVERGMVWLDNGQKFEAEPEVHGTGTGYRNAIVELQRTEQGVFTATGLHYTRYRAQPKDAPSRGEGHGAGALVLPPDPPPGPPADVLPAGVTDGHSATNDAGGTDPVTNKPPPNDATSDAPAPPLNDVPASGVPLSGVPLSGGPLSGVPMSRTDPSASRISTAAPGPAAPGPAGLDSVALASSAPSFGLPFTTRAAAATSSRSACRLVRSASSQRHHPIVIMNGLQSRRAAIQAVALKRCKVEHLIER